MRRCSIGSGDWFLRPRPIDTRVIDWVPPDERASLPPYQRVWLRASGVLPDDPLLHACVVVYTSDMTLLDTTVLPHGVQWGQNSLMMASLDHAMWFHRPFRVDDWLLYDMHALSTSGGRGLVQGRIYDGRGTLVATTMQEGLMRYTPRA